MTTRAECVRTFSQADFDAFADLSGDDNPIHVDPQFSAGTRFGRTVAHGALLCSVLRGLIDEVVPGGTQVRQSTMYPAPSPAGIPLRFEVETTGGTDQTVTLTLKITRLNDDTVTCTGETEVLR